MTVALRRILFLCGCFAEMRIDRSSRLTVVVAVAGYLLATTVMVGIHHHDHGLIVNSGMLTADRLESEQEAASAGDACDHGADRHTHAHADHDHSPHGHSPHRHAHHGEDEHTTPPEESRTACGHAHGGHSHEHHHPHPHGPAGDEDCATCLLLATKVLPGEVVAIAEIGEALTDLAPLPPQSVSATDLPRPPARGPPVPGLS